MDWSEERYIRLYTRDTVDWEMLPWESRALWPNLLRKLDRAGLLPLGRHGVAGLSILVKLPVEVVEPGLEALHADGSVVLAGDVLLVPNFIEAQEARQSDRMRQSESRARRREIAQAIADGHITEQIGDGQHGTPQIVTKRDRPSRNVTIGHETQQNVTPIPRLSHLVTPSLAVPSLAVEDPPLPPTSGEGVESSVPKAKARGRRQRHQDPHVEAVRAEVLALIGVDYPPAAWDGLRARLRDGATVQDALAYVRWAAQRPWEGEEVRLDPTVLFRASRFAAGLAKARTAPPRRHVSGIPPEAPPAQRQPPKPGDRLLMQCRGCVSMHPATWDGERWAMTNHDGCDAPEARTA